MPRARQRKHRTNAADERSTTCPVLRRPHRAVAPARADFPSLPSRCCKTHERCEISRAVAAEDAKPSSWRPSGKRLLTMNLLLPAPLSAPRRAGLRRRGLVRANTTTNYRPGEALPNQQSRSGEMLPGERGSNLSLRRTFSDPRAGRVEMGAAIRSWCLVSDLFSGSELLWHPQRSPRLVWPFCGSPSPLCSATWGGDRLPWMGGVPLPRYRHVRSSISKPMVPPHVHAAACSSRAASRTRESGPLAWRWVRSPPQEHEPASRLSSSTSSQAAV